MKRGLSLILYALFSFNVAAQPATLTGQVVDAATLEPLPHASVFINGTTIGVNADQSGKFVLKNVPQGEYEVAFSYVGYETFRIKSNQLSALSDMVIKLKAAELKEIEITAKTDDKWKSQLKDFESRFLGSRRTNCKILNPWVLDFAEIGNNALVAEASAPLEIENLELGYHVTYILTEFTATPTQYNIQGISYFKEISTEDKKLQMRWKQNRIKSYRSSVRHLLKSLIDDKLKEEGFDLYEDKSAEHTIRRNESFAINLGTALTPYKAKATRMPGKKGNFLIQLPARVEVHYLHGNRNLQVYRDINYAIGWIEVNGGLLLVNATGMVMNHSALVVSGYLTEPRVAQMLPDDFDIASISTVKSFEVD